MAATFPDASLLLAENIPGVWGQSPHPAATPKAAQNLRKARP